MLEYKRYPGPDGRLDLVIWLGRRPDTEGTLRGRYVPSGGGFWGPKEIPDSSDGWEIPELIFSGYGLTEAVVRADLTALRKHGPGQDPAANDLDLVNHPPHYKTGGIETIDFIEAKALGYHLGNVVKYITRADHKGTPLQDLKKARWYLDREIARLEGAT